MRRGTFLDLLAASLGRWASCPSGGRRTFAHRASTGRNKKLARGVRHPAPTPCALRLIQVAQPRWRRHQHRQHPQMPQMAKNAITPMTVHMTMLFILHLRFVLSKGPIPPDGAHYALFPLHLSVGETTEIKFQSDNRRKKSRRHAISSGCANELPIRPSRPQWSRMPNCRP